LNTIGLLFSFRGRIGRARFLLVQLALLALWFVLMVKPPPQFSAQWQALLFVWATVITLIWINVTTTVKRLHDRNRSGWWAVAILVLNRLCYVYYGLFFGLSFGVDISIGEELLLVLLALAMSLLQTWVFIELVFLTGTEGANQYGPDPTSAVTGPPIASSAGPYGAPDFLVRRAGSSPA
jgi:uncharacterized membrane protein YhaH (DUF805 family)